MRSSPWYQQKRSESAPPAERPRAPPSISSREQDEITDRISRPTESALYRRSLYWKLDSFMDRGFHSWSKMDLFSDCKRCMWQPDGSIKKSCKIRPIDTASNTGSLPPLRTGRESMSRERSSTNLDRSSLRTAGSENGNGLETSRSTYRGGEVMSNGNNGRYSIPNARRSLTNGLNALGSVSGARYRLHNRQAPSHMLAGSIQGNKGQYPARVHSLAVPRMSGVAT